jgi:2-keto-4-pentenoate hydratase
MDIVMPGAIPGMTKSGTRRMNAWDHPLIQKGMPAQLAKRRARIAAGEKPLGWKVGLGAPAAMERLGLQAPVVGFLMQRALVLSGGTVSFAGWTKPVAEVEICVRMATDLRGGATPETALAAVKEILPAIELADFDPPPTPDNIDVVLEGDIYQRHVVLCGNTRFGGSVSGLTSRLFRRGEEVSHTTDPEALTGKLAGIVAHVANTLAAYGEKLSAGDVIITGSITPPIMIEDDETEIGHVLDPIGEVSVNFTRD